MPSTSPVTLAFAAKPVRWKNPSTKRRSDAANIDAEAAAVILERWLAAATASH